MWRWGFGAPVDFLGEGFVGDFLEIGLMCVYRPERSDFSSHPIDGYYACLA